MRLASAHALVRLDQHERRSQAPDCGVRLKVGYRGSGLSRWTLESARGRFSEEIPVPVPGSERHPAQGEVNVARSATVAPLDLMEVLLHLARSILIHIIEQQLQRHGSANPRLS